MDYQTRKFNQKKIKIAYIGDVHVGSLNSHLTAFEKTIDWILQNDAHVICMGDLIDAITPNDVRFDPDNVDRTYMTMGEQLDYVEEQLSRIPTERFIGMVAGNHYGKWATKACVKEKAKICQRLGGHFFGLHALLDIVLNEDDSFTTSFWHGAGGGYEMGSIVNRMSKEPRSFNADVYLMGHSHRLFHFSSVMLNNARVKEERQKIMQFVNTGCYLASYEEGIGGYGESKGYSPQPIGFSVVTFEAGRLPLTQDMMWYRGRFEGGIDEAQVNTNMEIAENKYTESELEKVILKVMNEKYRAGQDAVKNY